MLFVLFGPPGVGKTYIGTLLSKKLDMYFFDADDQISEHEAMLLRTGQYDQSARNLFIGKLLQKANELLETYSDVIIAEAFTKEKNKKYFMDQINGEVRFIKVNAPKKIAKERTLERLKKSKHVITPKLFNLFWKIFDKPEIAYQCLNNKNESDDNLVKEFLRIR